MLTTLNSGFFFNILHCNAAEGTNYCLLDFIFHVSYTLSVLELRICEALLALVTYHLLFQTAFCR